MRLKAVGAEILAALTLACPVLAFSEPIGSDDAVIDADDTIAADTPDSDSNDTAWLSASKDTSTQVTAEVDSFYTLTVPEEITLSGTDGTGIKTGTISVTLRKRGKNSPSFMWGMNCHTFKLMERANRVHL
jgi:hypothetical protein